MGHHSGNWWEKLPLQRSTMLSLTSQHIYVSWNYSTIQMGIWQCWAYQLSILTRCCPAIRADSSFRFFFLFFCPSGLQLKYVLFPKGNLSPSSAPQGKTGAHRNSISDDAQSSTVRSRHRDVSLQVEPLLSSSGLFCPSFPHGWNLGLHEIQLLK